MAALIARAKRALPWWAKIAAKLALSRLPLGGASWQKLGLFEPGAMDDAAYALKVFRTHFVAAGAPLPGFAFLELGPGDSLASAVIGRAFGAARAWLVDAGAYASRERAVYERLFDLLDRELDGATTAELRRAEDITALLAACGARYLEGGLASLEEVPGGACDFAFSQAVLEHVPRAEFAATCAELHRILKRGGIMSHQIDFRDHLGGGLNHLRFSSRLWEAPWFARRSGFYTNRLSLAEIREAMELAGFRVLRAETERWPEPPLSRRALAAEFQDRSEAELRVFSVFMVLQRP